MTAALHDPVERPEVNHALEVKKVLAGMGPARLAFQPIVDLDRGEVVGYEALARFGAGHRSPAPYFRAADELDRRAELEALLVQQGLDLRPELPEGCFLALNVTPALLLAGPVWSVLTEAGHLGGVVLELTEHARVDNLPRLRRRLDTVRSCGGTLALDDVGAGWSGLQQVVELRPDIVKIDRSLVQRLHLDPARRAVAELLGDFTDRVGGLLLAEGVEQVDELDTLLELNVHLAQGYLLGRPLFGWPGVSPGAQEVLALRARRDRRVGSLARPVPCVRTLAALGFLDGGLPPAALVVHEDRTVDGVWVRNPYGESPSGWQRPAVFVPADTPLSAALAQAMGREEPDRFDPLVCVDGNGVVLGTVDVGALVTALL